MDLPSIAPTPAGFQRGMSYAAWWQGEYRQPWTDETMQTLLPQQQFVYVRDRISYDQENLPVEVLISVDRDDFFRAYRYRVVEDELDIGSHAHQ